MCHAVQAQDWPCPHCDVGDGFQEFLQSQPQEPGSSRSDVSVLWATHVEVIPITEDIGGWENPSFHQKLAAEAIRGWRNFRNKIAPQLRRSHPIRKVMTETHAGALNDGFFNFQKSLFDLEGDIQATIDEKEPPSYEDDEVKPPDANTSWPEMNALPEYRRLRRIVEKFSRRYLIRSGMKPDAANSLNYTVFNWAAVHGPGEYHGPHTHVGEYHAGVFYAQIGPGAGKLVFGDPRGTVPPFGRTYYHTPKAGQLVLFPSWLKHMATVTAASSDIVQQDSYKNEPYRVIFSFNIGPDDGRLADALLFSDPTGDMRFTRSSPIDREQFKL